MPLRDPRLTLVGALLLLVAVAASCSSNTSSQGATTPTTTAAPTTTGTQPGAPTGLKPAISGLIDRCGTGAQTVCPQPWSPPAAWASQVTGWVINADWSDLQPTPDGPIAPDNVIDRNLARVAQLDQENPSAHLAVKLRIYGGAYAPDWAKNIGGAPIAIRATDANVNGTVGRFWTPDYGKAWARFQSELAAKYDSNPYLRDVTISRCMTVFAEPFIRDISDKQTVQNLLAAGYTYQQDEQCQMDAVQEAKVWKRTRQSLSFNPYQQINPSGSTTINEAFTEEMMHDCRQELGPQCVLENNSISTPPNPAYTAMYAEMKALGGPIAFQTVAHRGIEQNLGETVQWALAQGASVVELPSDYKTMISPDSVAALVPQLVAKGAAANGG